MSSDGLTPKQARFVQEYLKDLNATQAAISAGYSAKTAESLGSRLLRNVKVATAIQRSMDARAQRLELKADDILRELLRIGMSDVRKLFDSEGRLLPVGDFPDDIAHAVSSVEVEQLFEGTGRDRFQSGVTVKVKLWDKVKGLELLGKNLKLFTDRIEHSGQVTLAELVVASVKPQGET